MIRGPYKKKPKFYLERALNSFEVKKDGPVVRKNERPAKGVKGFVMAGPIGALFRVYDYSTKPASFTDYEITNDDLEVEITDDGAAFYEATEKNPAVLDYSSEVLGKK